MAETIQTFIGGMDFDTDKVLRSNSVTHLVENMRLVTDVNGTTGALESLKGNKVHRNLTTIDRVYASCHIGNLLILFGKKSTANVISKLTLSGTEEVLSEVEIYSDTKNNSTGTLDFTEGTIKCIGKYESAGIIKVYWADNTNPVRFINVAVNNTTDGNIYSAGSNYYIAPDKLEFKPSFLVSNITSTEVKKGGNLTAGVVQYSIQLYNKYGAETVFSPLTNPLHVVESDDALSSSLKYKGSEIGNNTGKSVEITVNHLLANSGYDSMKIIRVQYTTYEGIPSITVVADIELNKYFTVPYEIYKVIDSGNSIYEYTSEEFAVLGSLLFSAKDINVKDNRLVAGNINEDYFDIDFDARTFRFSDGSYNVCFLTNGGVNASTVLASDTTGGWDSFVSSVPETHDAINLYNDLTYDNKTVYSSAVYNCKYQYGSAVLGGSGRNIKYEFVLNEFELDSNTNNNKSGTNVANRTIGATLDTGDNYSYTNYASPYMSQIYKGYQRGEIYRFGIVFFDVKGRSSKVKWIGDIRFPSFRDYIAGTDNRLAEYDSGTIKSDLIGIKFSVRNVPTDAVAWQIVRVKRTSIDKTVISQGIISNTISGSGGTGDHFAPYSPTTDIDNTAYSSYYISNKLLLYLSPDINYGTLDRKQTDYFETLGYFGNYGTYKEDGDTGAGIVENTIKYNGLSTITSYEKIIPVDFQNIELTAEDKTYTIGSYDFRNIITRSTGALNSTLGKSMVFTYTGTLPVSARTYPHSPSLVNLRRVNNSQYGGNTYENRFNNQYISCGVVINSGSASFTRTNTYTTGVDIYGGDIFISMFEKLYGVYSTGVTGSCRIVYVPLESQYNLNLNSGYTYSRNVDTDEDIYLIRENAGTHSDTSSHVLVQDENFYVYNTVYSNTTSPIIYFSESNIDSNIVEYKTRILISNLKTNNEIVDSWTRFSVNDYIDVDSTYGAINNIINYRDKIYYLQDKGFGVVSINDRAIITDPNNVSSIVLGTGGVLDRYDYISTYYGNKNIKGVVSNESGVYWVDNNRSEILLFDGSNVQPLSKLKKIDNFFKGIYNTITNVIAAYVPKYNEVWFKITTDEDLDILVFNELVASFTSFYTIPAKDFITLDKLFLTVYDGVDEDMLYSEGESQYNCRFYGTRYPVVLQILHTENYPYTKVYDNIEYNSVASTENMKRFDITFNTIQVYNDHQNTDEWDLILNGSVNTTLMQWPITRRERNWTLAIPRNVVSSAITVPVDIFDSVNLNATNLFKDRIRDNYAVIRLTYDDSYILYIPFITVKYRLSQR